MNVKVFMTKNLGWVASEVTEELDNGWMVKNPRYIQAFAEPSTKEGETSNLSLHLSPVLYLELLTEGRDLEILFDKSDYTDYTEQFNPTIIEMYTKVESRVMKARGDEPEDNDSEPDNVVKLGE